MKIVRFIPNILTLFRLFLSAPIAYYLWHRNTVAALILLLLAGATDLLDGFLARNFNARTVVGSWLDPTADKILITTILLTLAFQGAVPLWYCYISIGRDAGIIFGVLMLLTAGVKVKINPRLTGKLAAVFQNFVLLFAIFREMGPQGVFFTGTLYTSAALNLISLAKYGRSFLNHLKGLPF